MRTSFWLGLVLGLALGGAAVRAADATSETPSSPFERECHGMVMSMERDIAVKDAAFVDRYFDLEACVDRALEGLNPPSSLEKTFRAGLRETFKDSFGKPMLNASSVRYLRMRRVEKEPRFLFRVVPKEGGVNYFELIFDRTRRNGVKVVDIFNYSLGQNIAYTFRHAFLPICKEADRGWFEQLDKKDAEFVKHLDDMNKMMSANARGRWTETLAIYATLPESLRKEKLFLVYQMQAAVRADSRALNAAIDLWRSTYPGESSVDLIAANFHIARRSYEPAFAALERFDKALGGDAYIDVMRGQQFKNQSRWDDARAAARSAVARNPKLSEGWELLISIGLSTRNYSEVAQTLTEWESKAKVDVDRVAQSDKLYDFARSTAGQQWLGGRAAGRPATPTPVANTPPKPTPAPKPTGAEKPKAPPKLQGIFFTSRPSAIISGQTVFTGDRLPGGYRVEKISQTSVTLTAPDGELTELKVK